MSSASSDLIHLAAPARSAHESTSGKPGDLADAIYFDSGGQRIFGWLHVPPGPSFDLGLVICKPFGYEAICSHRGLRAFAEAAVALGMPTLRFDYLGTGDSGEIDPEADQLKVWTRDVAAAIAELRRRTGVRQVCVLGIRLGALLAALAAAECPDVTSLVLVAPTLSGRRYVREMRTTRMAGMMGSAVPAGESSGTATGIPPGSMEVSGFIFSAATLAALRQVELQSTAMPGVKDMLVIDSNRLQSSKPWAEQLEQSGLPTRYLALPGLIEMIMTAPQFAAVPEVMIGAARDWWILRLSGASSLPNGAKNVSDAPSFPALPLPGDTQGKSLTERPVFFGPDSMLFGIVTEPAQGEVRRRAVILLNAGADYHIGVSAMNVDLARDWARRGYVALRMDLAGLGDSGTRPGQAGNEVFPPAVLDDIRSAVELVRVRYAAANVTLFGLCSGAYHALRAAVDGVSINRILMVNPQNYFWKEGMTLDDLQIAEVVHNPGLYRRRVFSLDAWKKLLAGQTDVWRIAKIYFYRPLLALESALRDLARWLHLRLPNDLGTELLEVRARGVRMVFVFARGEPGMDLLKIQAGSAIKRLGKFCRIHVIDGADHIFSQNGPRAIMKKKLRDELLDGA